MPVVLALCPSLPVAQAVCDCTAIIATKNRPFELARTVQSLAAQRVRPRQLVVVDQSAAVECHGRLRELLAGGEIELDYMHDPALTGTAAARNRGMARARGEIWLFLDDDVELEPEFTAELMAAYAAAPEAAGISGIVTNYPPPPLAYRAWSGMFQRGALHDDRQPLYWRAERLRHSAPIRVRCLGGGLMSFRAAAIRDLRFDERHTGSAPGEDVAFCRELAAEARLYVAPRARLMHLRTPNQRERRHWLGPQAEAVWLWRGARRRPGGLPAAGAWLGFWWFNCGCAAAATLACARRLSPAPARDWLAGIQRARAATGSSTV